MYRIPFMPAFHVSWIEVMPCFCVLATYTEQAFSKCSRNWERRGEDWEKSGGVKEGREKYEILKLTKG